MQVPQCPTDHVTLWDGFSLLHTEDEGRAHVQDLGKKSVIKSTPMFLDWFLQACVNICGPNSRLRGVRSE